MLFVLENRRDPFATRGQELTDTARYFLELS